MPSTFVVNNRRAASCTQMSVLALLAGVSQGPLVSGFTQHGLYKTRSFVGE
jgi:hypothetical protein